MRSSEIRIGTTKSVSSADEPLIVISIRLRNICPGSLHMTNATVPVAAAQLLAHSGMTARQIQIPGSDMSERFDIQFVTEPSLAPNP